MSKGLSSINISVPRGQIRAIIEFTASYVQHRPTYWLNKNYFIVYKGLLRDLPKGHNYVQHRPTYPKVHVAYLKAMLFSNYVGYDMGYIAYLGAMYIT